MTVMLMALFFSESALNASKASEYRVLGEHETELFEPNETVTSHRQGWTPRVQIWTIEKTECPAFFRSEVEGFGQFRVGPRCPDEEVPYAL